MPWWSTASSGGSPARDAHHPMMNCESAIERLVRIPQSGGIAIVHRAVHCGLRLQGEHEKIVNHKKIVVYPRVRGGSGGQLADDDLPGRRGRPLVVRPVPPAEVVQLTDRVA